MTPRHLEIAAGFDPVIGRIAAMLTNTRSRLLRDLEDVVVAELDPTPEWGPNSIGTLLYHIAAAELRWTFSSLRETDRFPDGREAWFPVETRDDAGRLSPVVDQLDRHLARLEWVRGHLFETLRGLRDADLDRTFNPGENESGGSWILHHLMQHEAEHRGQIGEIKVALRV